AAEILAEFEDPRARELLKWAEATLARSENIPARTGLSGIFDRASGLFGKLRGETPHMRVSQSEVKFRARVGYKAAPSSVSVSVESETPWQTHADRNWIRAVQQNGKLIIHVKSQGLAPGPYSGSVAVVGQGGRDRAEVAVSLTVER